MVGLISLEVYNSSFKTTETKIELHTDTFDEFPFEEIKKELGEIPNFSDITPSHLQHEIIGPRNIPSYKKLR